jgi:hypothetical protein
MIEATRKGGPQTILIHWVAEMPEAQFDFEAPPWVG